MVIRVADDGRQESFVRLWHVVLWSVVLCHGRVNSSGVHSRKGRWDELGEVGADTLLAVLLCFLLGLLEDEVRYVAVEVFVCDGAGN